MGTWLKKLPTGDTPTFELFCEVDQRVESQNYFLFSLLGGLHGMQNRLKFF